MPFWKPGSLSEEDAWKVTAFVLRENKLWNGVDELNDSNAGEVLISRAAFLTPVAAHPQDPVQKSSGAPGWMILIGSLTMLIIVVFVIHRKQKYDPNSDI
jgi:hypothetical protein